MMSAKKEYETNPVVKAIVPSTASPSQAMDDAKAQQTNVMERIKENAINFSEELQRFILKDCAKALEILEKHQSAEIVEGYKKMVLDFADKIANAAKEGEFLGFGGGRFSENEQELFSKLKSRMN